MKKALLLAIALAFSAAAIAEQYKWTDKNGKVQYGDAPPPGVKATPLRAVPPPATQPAAKAADAKGADKKGPMNSAEQDADFRKRQQEASKDREKQAQATQQAEAKKENCSRAQEMQRSLETGRVARTDAKGERYYLDEAQIAQETAKARQLVQQWCN
jgi:uncharacterized protein DUF4124